MMLKRLIFSISPLLLCLQLYAQKNDKLRPLSIQQDNYKQLNSGLSLDDFTDVMVDSFKSASIQDAVKSEAFQALESFEFDSKYERGRYAYWLRFALENTLDDPIHFSFSCGNFDSLSIFKNDVLLDQFGKMVRSNSTIENPSKLIRATNLQLAPKTKAVYYVNIRNSPGIPRYISPVLITEKSLLLELLINSNDKWYILYLQLGALLIMGLYFLTQLIFKRSQILAYYNLYLFFMLIYLSRGIFMNHPTTHFYPPGFYDYFYYSIITMAVLISYIQFIKSVIQQVIPTEIKLVSILNWMILGSCLWFICDRALLMYDYSIAWKFSNIFHVLSMSFYFIMSIRLLQFKNSILTIIAIGTLVLNLFFLSMIIAKIMISFSDSPMGVWIHPATCLAVLAELFLFIVSIKKMESFEKLKTQHVLQTVKREKDALIHNVTRTNNIRRHEQDLDFIDRIDSIISDNMDNSQFNANQLYHILGTNHVSLNKKLKEILNMSTHQYIQHKKLEHSKQLVLKSDISFSEIAYQIGLNDSAYFSKLFKKKFGKSPSSFRKQLGNHAQIQNSPI